MLTFGSCWVLGRGELCAPFQPGEQRDHGGTFSSVSPTPGSWQCLHPLISQGNIPILASIFRVVSVFLVEIPTLGWVSSAPCSDRAVAVPGTQGCRIGVASPGCTALTCPDTAVPKGKGLQGSFPFPWAHSHSHGSLHSPVPGTGVSHVPQEGGTNSKFWVRCLQALGGV